MAKRNPKIAPVVTALPSATANADVVPSVYVNNMEILAVSPLDVRLGFNEVLAESQNRFTVVRRANVVMAKQHFLAMMQVLNNALGQIATKEELEAVSSQFVATARKPPSA